MIHSFQSTWVPYIENTYGAFWNNWRLHEGQLKSMRNNKQFCDNVMATSTIAQTIHYLQISMHTKHMFSVRKMIVKEISRIALILQERLQTLQENLAKNRGGMADTWLCTISNQ